MRKMILDYRKSRGQVQKRIRELNAQLKSGKLMNAERENVKQRRDMLQYESIDMLHIIKEMESHL